MAKTSARNRKRKKPELSYSAQGIIRHAYEQMLTRAARLSSFAYASVLPDNTDVVERQTQLAIDDLVTLAIYTRQAIENSGLHEKLRAVEMPVFYGAEPKPTPIIDVINKIIHHQFIHMWRHASDFKNHEPFADFKGDLAEWLKNYRKGIPAAVAIKSDRGKLIGFRVATLVDAILEGLLEPLVEHCSDCGLYLESIYSV